ncbi:hypothetical protein [Streptomyces noursei]|uniref:hypothetical protein n=1 Tax=Streptomyces noursei TaxID=1971 RepID=UPI00167BFD01|nr:hypothetical protein [Streptomyces noursei]MCZ1021262.1 hypothetical protein [Streptomyces noursei]GGX54816.1 hypothetical protein GCM10010341_89800 [Streptomyces noursei]
MDTPTTTRWSPMVFATPDSFQTNCAVIVFPRHVAAGSTAGGEPVVAMVDAGTASGEPVDDGAVALVERLLPRRAEGFRYLRYLILTSPDPSRHSLVPRLLKDVQVGRVYCAGTLDQYRDHAMGDATWKWLAQQDTRFLSVPYSNLLVPEASHGGADLYFAAANVAPSQRPARPAAGSTLVPLFAWNRVRVLLMGDAGPAHSKLIAAERRRLRQHPDPFAAPHGITLVVGRPSEAALAVWPWAVSGEERGQEWDVHSQPGGPVRNAFRLWCHVQSPDLAAHRTQGQGRVLEVVQVGPQHGGA